MAEISQEEMARRIALAVRQFNERNPDDPITDKDIKDRPGPLGKLQLLYEGLKHGTKDRLMENTGRFLRAGDSFTDNSVRGQLGGALVRENERELGQRVPSRQEVAGDEDATAWYKFGEELPTNIAASLPGVIGGGVLGAIGGPIGSIIGSIVGGTASTAGAYYRIGRDKFLSDIHEQFRARYGREPTRAEIEGMNRLYEAKAGEYAKSQAVQEGIVQGVSSAIPGGILLKMMKPGAGGAIKAIGRTMPPGLGVRGVMAVGENVANEAMSPERDTQAGQAFQEMEQARQTASQAGQAAEINQVRW